MYILLPALENVPFVIDKSPVVAPVNVPVPTVNSSALSSKPKNILFELPLSPTIPTSPDGVPDVPVANSISLSDITEFVVSKVVVVPDTVKLPETVALPDKFNEAPVIAPAFDISTASFKTKFVLSDVFIFLSEITTVPEVKLVIPVIVEPEKDMALIGILDNVFAEPLIDLFVSVAVVSLIAACIWDNVALPSVPPSETKNKSLDAKVLRG